MPQIAHVICKGGISIHLKVNLNVSLFLVSSIETWILRINHKFNNSSQFTIIAYYITTIIYPLISNHSSNFIEEYFTNIMTYNAHQYV